MADPVVPQEQRPIEEQVRLEYHDKVAVITIDRPEVGNALNPPCRNRIRDLFNEFNTNHRARAVVLTASGDKLFCPGADLSHKYENDRAEDIPERVIGDPRRMMMDGQYTLFPAILDCDIPVIAAVNGTAAGMGAHLALACDLVVCSDQSKFVEVFARRGLVPDALGSWLLPRIIGVRRTMELMLFAEDIHAEKALDWGLANKVVPHAELMDSAMEWAQRLAAGPTRSFGFTKWLVNQSLDTDRRTMMENEALAVELNTYTADSEEGVASFRERRDPTWKGY
jgi:2-(1,2-epoxy-1,2-dihydrophenyl)acetyl-CoA isomerase